MQSKSDGRPCVGDLLCDHEDAGFHTVPRAGCAATQNNNVDEVFYWQLAIEN